MKFKRDAVCAAVVAGLALMLSGAADAPIHGTGAVPIDPVVYAALPKVKRHRAWLPQSVDLSAQFPAPGDQGIESDCVEWASVYAARSFLHAQEIGHRPTQPDELASPAYIFNRLRPAGSSCAVPTQVMDALNMLKNEGVVSIADYPDDWRKCRTPAPDSLRSRAGNLRISDWRAVDRESQGDWRTPLVLDDVKGSLARGVPVIFAMPVADDFVHWKGDAVYRRDQADSQNWHAMALVGYDEARQAVRVINSWGQDWGDHGYVWIDYATFKRLAGEAYALEPARTGIAPAPVQVVQAQSPIDRLRHEASTLPCGSVDIHDENGRAVATGYGGEKDPLDQLRADAQAAGLTWRVAYHPWPQCEAETTLATPLSGSPVKLWLETPDGQTRRGDPVLLRGGDKFGIGAQTTAERPYLTIIYLQADGSAVELYRGQPDGGRVDLGISGARAVRFEVGEPYGDEILIALASTQPPFGGEKPAYQTERQFLTALRAQVLGDAGGDIAAAVLRLKSSG
jgi:hypothetical protein